MLVSYVYGDSHLNPPTFLMFLYQHQLMDSLSFLYVLQGPISFKGSSKLGIVRLLGIVLLYGGKGMVLHLQLQFKP